MNIFLVQNLLGHMPFNGWIKIIATEDTQEHYGRTNYKEINKQEQTMKRVIYFGSLPNNVDC